MISQANPKWIRHTGAMWRRKLPAPSAMQTQEQKMNVAPFSNVTIGLMMTCAIKFASGFSVRFPNRRASYQCLDPATYRGGCPR